MQVQNKKVSVVIATYNGAHFIKQQLASILSQLNENDEIIISDNFSTDRTLAEIESLNDSRIKIYLKKRESTKGNINCYFNFENALNYADGDIIFLSDQDDIWKDNKVAVCLEALENNDIVVSDCKVISETGEIILDSYFKRRKSGKGFVKNFISNSYIGSCIAFKRKILNIALPFPKKMPMHDILLGTIGELFFDSIFITEQLVYSREHSNNVSYTAKGISGFNLFKKIQFRWQIIKYLPLLVYRRLTNK